MIIGVGTVGLRIDLLYQSYSGAGRTFEYTGVDAKQEEEVSGHRVLLSGGVEF